MRGLAPLAIAIALLTSASAAQAASLYASPSGGTAPGCPQGNPCSLDSAFSQSASGDEVVALAGDYHRTTNVTVPAGRLLRGADGDRPRILIGASAPVFTQGVIVFGNDPNAPARVRHIVVVTSNDFGTAMQIFGNAVVEDVGLSSSSSTPTVIMSGIAPLLRHAFVFAQGSNGIGVRAQSSASSNADAHLRNVTVVANGSNSVGAAAHGNGYDPGTGTCPARLSKLTIRNTIVRGNAVDLRRTGDPVANTCNPQATIDANYSNYRTTDTTDPFIQGSMSEGANNQKSAAQTDGAAIFADLSFRQRPTSPTVNAGAMDAKVGSADLDGDLVPQGGAPDIGFDEYPVAPGVTTGAPSGVTSSGATFSATVDSAAASKVHFEYGTTDGYGQATPVQDVPPGGGAVTATIDGLSPTTAYLVRAVATTGSGAQLQTTRGTGVAFTTLAPGGPGGAADADSLLLADLAVPASMRLRTALRRGIPLSFTLLRTPSAYAARLTAKLPARRRGRVAARRKRTVTLGKLSARNQAAGPVSARLRISKAGRRALRRPPRRLRTTFRLTVTEAAGLQQTVTRAIVLRR